MSRRTLAIATWETECAACPHPITAGDRIEARVNPYRDDTKGRTRKSWTI